MVAPNLVSSERLLLFLGYATFIPTSRLFLLAVPSLEFLLHFPRWLPSAHFWSQLKSQCLQKGPSEYRNLPVFMPFIVCDLTLPTRSTSSPEDRFFDLWAVVFQLWFGRENKHYSMDSTFEGF